MTDAKENPHRGDGSGFSKHVSKCYGISAASQRQRIIPALIQAGTWEQTEAEQLHRVARYVLLGLPAKGEFFCPIKKGKTGVSVAGGEVAL